MLIQGKTADQAIFFPEGTPVEMFLKPVEDYAGNLAVFSAMDVGEVMRSRFSRLMNRIPIKLDTSFGKPSGLEEELAKLKEIV